MSEERTEYTVHPDIAVRLEVSEKHIQHLTSTIDGMTMVMGRHADTITAQAARIAELEAALHDTTAQLATATETIARLEQEVKGYRLSAAVMEGAYVTSDDAATKLKETIARLEADNRRLRHLDAMPVDAMRRTHKYSARMVNASKAAGYTLDAWELDHSAISEWLMTLDGDA